MLCDAKAWGKGLRSGQLGEAVAACLSVDGVLCDAAVASFADQLEALEAHLLQALLRGRHAPLLRERRVDEGH